jgi:hypothetical protein
MILYYNWYLFIKIYVNSLLGIDKVEKSSAPVSTGNTFQDLPRLRETADNTERYI